LAFGVLRSKRVWGWRGGALHDRLHHLGAAEHRSCAVPPVLAITNPGAWLNWSNPEAVMRFIYYGGSVEFFFVVFTIFLVITALGMFWKREILWGCVRGLEAWPTCRPHRRLGGPHHGAASR
jgi:hypothetical protein